MTKPVQIPDPVYDAVSLEAERRDVPRGAIIAEWKDKADKYGQLEERR